jgi:HPt (histidine-containing phosphotransfer) domain-containing protein
MNPLEYTDAMLAEQVLIDLDQWARLKAELGGGMVKEFANEFFEEIKESWFDVGQDPFALNAIKFRSLAHRTAGAAGTLGFHQLRFVFLCLEHSENDEATRRFFSYMQVIFEQTEQWVLGQFTSFN